MNRFKTGNLSPCMRKQLAKQGFYVTYTEAELQAGVESMLQDRGYMPRESDDIMRNTSGRWYFHMRKPQDNPILCDLFIFDSKRDSYIEMELKKEGGRLTPEQKALHGRQEIAICRSVPEARRTVELWERQKPRRRR